MIVRRVLRMSVLPLLVTMVVLHGQKRLVSAEQPLAADRTVPSQGSPELSLATAAALASVGASGDKSGRRAAGGVVVIINEVDADQTSTDTAEFVELYDGGFGGTDLSGLVLVLMNGSDDASYLSFDLDGMSTNGQGYFVLCGNAANVPNCDLDVAPNSNLIQNGADAVALYIGDASDFPNDTPVTTTDLLDAIVYGTNDGDDAGLLVLLNAGQPQVNECGGAGCSTDSNQRCPNGSGGARNTDTYAQATPTAGQGNNCAQAFGACCLEEGCLEDVSQEDCVSQGGEFQGGGSDCSACPTCSDGACGDEAACDDGDPYTTDTCGDDGCCEHKPELETGPSCAACRSDTAGTDQVANPVYLFSGEKYESVVDLQIPGRGQDFSWARKYRSKIGPNTAQGNGWDFSYNIHLEQDGDDFVLFDGNTRQDTYRPNEDGTWAVAEFFRLLTDDGGLVLTFPDLSTWNFNPFDGSPQQGKISSSVDRNGNTISFDYDGLGRLVTIHDPLDTPAHNRDITISYNADGFIESVTDFAGRSVIYEYYQDGDAGGSFGDLKSVRTPVVVNTAEFPIPAGHEYPDGKTTVYTYSKDFADERLNHDLLTVKDPKGQTFLKVFYAHTIDAGDPRHTEDPANIYFDRVVREIVGDDTPEKKDIIDFVYVPLDPAEEDDSADTQVIVNDRVGNVTEYRFTAQNVNVRQREYTGRWDADQPTFPADLANPTTARLRDGDDPFFETRWEYNDDALATRVIHPNGNEEVTTFDEGNPSRRSQGNSSDRCRLPGTHTPPGDQAQICEHFEYDDGFGGCCGSNFVTEHTDARGNVTVREYDDFGNRTKTTHRIPSIVEDMEYNEFGQMTAHILPDNGSGHRRRDEFTYYDSGPQLGYLHEQIVDVPNFELTTVFEYNLVGQVTRTIDPRGHDSVSIVNQLDQVVRTISREVTEGGGVRYERDTFYDPNDNVVRVDIQNKDDAGVLQPNTHFTEIYEYEILNYRTRTCQEDGDYTGSIPGTQEVPLCGGLPETEFITTEYQYDANRNRNLSRYGEAVNGNQPANTVRTLYDERDLTFRQIRAEGDADQSTTQHDYDNNRNTQRTRQGLEDAGGERITTNTYDGYDRLVTSSDPMGNVTEFHYDPNSNRESARTDGELIDVPGGAGNVRLSEGTYVYDAMDRQTRSEIEFFDTDTQGAIGDGQSVSETEWSDNSQVVSVTNDNSHTTTTTYDTVNRVLTVTDAKGNIVKFETAKGQTGYDANSNVISVREIEKSDLGGDDEEFTTTSAYDGLDRLTQTVDNVGNAHNFKYDSRDNQTAMTDALLHETRYVYDGINRLTTTLRDLDDDGADGDGDDIVTTQSWDDTSRLTAQGDDNGNNTRYAYDALNRLIVTQMADGTIHQVGTAAAWPLGDPQPDLAGFTSGFDVHDNRLTTEDANGSFVESQFDLLNRPTHKDITPGLDVSDDITFENYKYDGLSRLVSAEDDDSLVTRSYDSLSRTTRETLNVVPPFDAGDDRTTSCLYDGVGNEILSTYPGGRVVFCEYDDLERKKSIFDGPDNTAPLIASYDYVGPGRVTLREYGNGTRTDYKYDGITGTPKPPDFGVKRIIGTTHTKIIDGAIIDDRTFAYDKRYNKIQRADIRDGGPELTHDYEYDSIYRLTRSVKTPPGAPTGEIIYDLDGVGNRTNVIGGPDAGPYTMDPTLPEPADFQTNQYTTTSADARLYDQNGNLVRIDDGLPAQRDLKYDNRNQMVEYLVVATGQRHTYAYDALGRRIVKVVDADGLGPGSPTETRYFYDGWQVCEEQDAAGATLATYVYGLYIDEVLNMQRGGSDFYYHTDDLYNVMAVTDGVGDVVEHYEYGDYGQPAIMDAEGCNVSCPFDVNGNGQVEAFDLANLLGCWGPTAPGVCECLDVDKNGNIDAFDLANLLGSWGPCATPSSAVGNPYMFTGRRWDPETGWYYYRTRYLDPIAGRFTTRDVVGIWYDPMSLGNGYAYAGTSPWTNQDPLGMGFWCRRSCDIAAVTAAGLAGASTTITLGQSLWAFIGISSGYIACNLACDEADRPKIPPTPKKPIPSPKKKKGPCCIAPDDPPAYDAWSYIHVDHIKGGCPSHWSDLKLRSKMKTALNKRCAGSGMTCKEPPPGCTTGVCQPTGGGITYFTGTTAKGNVCTLEAKTKCGCSCL